MKRIFSTCAISVIIATLLSGCANNPQVREQERLTMDNADKVLEDKARELDETWSTRDPAITYTDREDGIFVQQVDDVPLFMSNKKIRNLTILPGSTLQDLSGILYPYKVNIMFDGESDDNNSDISQRKFSIKKYSGTVGELLSIIEKLHDISFRHIGGNSIKAQFETKYIASIPQNEEVLSAIEDGIASIGGEDIKTNKLTGSLIYSATQSEQQQIEAFFDRFYTNFAGVKLQLTVFSLSLQETLSDGFNWSELDFVLGHVEAAYAGGVINQMLQSLSGNNSTGSTGTQNQTNGVNGVNGSNGTNTNGSTGSDSSNSNQPDFGYGSRYAGSSIDEIRSFGWFKPDGIEVGTFNNNVSLSVVMDWLNQYGNTRSEQSAFLETITGKETTISSQRRVPVIGDESTTLVGNMTPVATQNTTTEEEEVGLKVAFTPYYESSSQEITIDLNLQLKNLIGSKTLTTANGNVIERPEIQEQIFPTTVRMKVGETKLLGGVIFDTLIESGNDINFLSDDEGYKSQQLSKSAVFILVRPSVNLFRAPKEEVQDGKN